MTQSKPGGAGRNGASHPRGAAWGALWATELGAPGPALGLCGLGLSEPRIHPLQNGVVAPGRWQLEPWAHGEPLASPVRGQLLPGLPGVQLWSPGRAPKQRGCLVQPQGCPRCRTPRSTGLGRDRRPLIRVNGTASCPMIVIACQARETEAQEWETTPLQSRGPGSGSHSHQPTRDNQPHDPCLLCFLLGTPAPQSPGLHSRCEQRS